MISLRMRSKPRALALLLALCLLFAASWARALEAQPAAGGEVAPGDSIAYSYTLPADMKNGALRLSLGPGLTLRESSVTVESSRSPEVIFGSDGFVIMADKLDKGDTISFTADVSSSALEIWARLTAGDDSISEEDGYAAHILVLPAQAGQDPAALAAAAEQEKEAAKPPAHPPVLLLGAAAAVMLLLGWAFFKTRALRRKREEAITSPPIPGPMPQPSPLDNTVEYLTIPDDPLPLEKK